MDDARYRKALLQKADTLVELQRQRLAKPLLGKMGQWIVGTTAALAAVFAVYQGALAIIEAHNQKRHVEYYKVLGRQYFLRPGGPDAERAVAAFREADELQPHNPEIQCYLLGATAFAHSSTKADLERADVQCKFTAQQHSLDAEGYDFVGVVYGRNENYADAEKAFEQAITLNGGSYDIAEYNLGRALAEHAMTFSRRTEPAQRADYLGRAISINRDLIAKNHQGTDTYGSALYNTACDYSLSGDVKNAIDFLSRAFEAGFSRYQVVATDSDLDGIRRNPRFVDLMKNRYVDGVNRITASLETHRAGDREVNALGWLQLFASDRSKLSDGIGYASLAHARNPDNAAYFGTLAELHAMRGDYAAAVKEVTMAASKDPTRPYYLERRNEWTNRTKRP